MSGASMAVSRQSLRRWAAIKRSLAQLETVVTSCDNMAKDLQIDAQQILDRLEYGKTDKAAEKNDYRSGMVRETCPVLSGGSEDSFVKVEEPLVARFRPSLDYIFCTSSPASTSSSRTDFNSNVFVTVKSSTSGSNDFGAVSDNAEEPSSSLIDKKTNFSMSSTLMTSADKVGLNMNLESNERSQHDSYNEAAASSPSDENVLLYNNAPILDTNCTSSDVNLSDEESTSDTILARGNTFDTTVARGNTFDATVAFDVTSDTAVACGNTSDTTVAFGVTSDTTVACGSTSDTTVAFGSTSDTTVAFGSTSDTTVACGDSFDTTLACGESVTDRQYESNYSVSELLDSVPNELPTLSMRFPSPKTSTTWLPSRRISEPKVLPSLMRLERDSSGDSLSDSAKNPPYQRSQSDVGERLMEVNAGKGDGRTRKFSAVAKNVRNVLQFFKRRTSEANAPAPPLDVVVGWSQNFSTLLSDKYGLMLFRSFLLSEYSEENIEFWIACEEYKKLKARQYPQKAQAIYSDFITVHAPKEVNLDSKTRMETMKALANPTKATFDLAQSRIQCLMEKDSYTRFLKSPAYTSVLSQARSSTATSE